MLWKFSMLVLSFLPLFLSGFSHSVLLFHPLFGVGFLFLMLADLFLLCCWTWNIFNLFIGSSLSSIQVGLNHKNEITTYEDTFGVTIWVFCHLMWDTGRTDPSSSSLYANGYPSCWRISYIGLFLSLFLMTEKCGQNIYSSCVHCSIQGLFAVVTSITIWTGSLWENFQEVPVPKSGQTRCGFLGTARNILCMVHFSIWGMVNLRGFVFFWCRWAL